MTTLLGIAITGAFLAVAFGMISEAVLFFKEVWTEE